MSQLSVERMRVLFIDGDPEVRERAAGGLERADDRLTVTTAGGASEGLAYLADETFDCVVAEYELPEWGGLEFLEAVRHEYPDLAYVLFTESEHVAGEVLSAGVSDYLRKGSVGDQFDVLAARIETAIEDHRARQSLQEQTRRLETLVSNLPGIVYRCESERGWPIERIDGDVEEITGYTAEALERREVDWGEDILHPEDQGEMWDDVQTAVSAGEPFEVTYRIVTKDREVRWMWERGCGVCNNGELEALEGVIIDITESKEQEREKDLFKQMVESLGVGLAVYDAEGTFRYVNPTYAEIFDTDVERVEGRSVWEINTELDEERFDQYWTSFEEGETRIHETVHAFEGKEVPVQAVTTHETIHGETFHFGTVQDITERKEYERKLERKNERLSEFASIVSHDLRNPLEVAAGHVQLAREERDTDRLEAVERAHDRMATLIEDILTLAREGKTVEDLVPVEIASILEDCWQTVDTAEATLVVDTEQTIRADRSRLQQLFENLFRNAVEHGGENVILTVGDLDGGFFVADDGPGIPKSERGEVFESGYSTSEGGTGYGLQIVEQIVAAHDWEISVTESDDGGARFEIRGVEVVE